jgi:hypothetical protein
MVPDALGSSGASAATGVIIKLVRQIVREVLVSFGVILYLLGAMVAATAALRDVTAGMIVAMCIGAYIAYKWTFPTR